VSELDPQHQAEYWHFCVAL